MSKLLCLWLCITAWPGTGWASAAVEKDSVAIPQTDTATADSNSLEYYQKILQEREQEVASAMIGIGFAYKNQGRYNSALKYYRQALPILSKVGSSQEIGKVHQAMGEIFEIFGDSADAGEYYPKALQQYEYSLATWKDTDSDSLLALAQGRLGAIQAKMGNYQTAYEHQLERADLLAEKFQERSAAPKQLSETNSTTFEESLQQPVTSQNWFDSNKWLLLLGGLLAAAVIALAALSHRLQGLKAQQSQWQTQYQTNLQQTEELQSINIALANTEKQQRRLNLTKDKLFSIISHDLRSPINTLTGFLSVLGSKLKSIGDIELKALAEDMEESTKRLSGFLDNLLKWSMTQMGQINVKPEAVDIKLVIEENVHLVREELKNKSIDLAVKTKGELSAHADLNMISLVIRNVLANAIKFTGPNGRIQINAVEDEDLVRISILDNGIGITKEDQEKLFDIEQQHIISGSTQDKGAGLGLMLCKEFVEMNGGNIEVDSQLGVGTTFTIELPKAKMLQPVTLEQPALGA
ncbi:MAG: tetratricopeptide repeat-containing sensor histidine kinase [Cyclobacteriaceae bacterium]